MVITGAFHVSSYQYPQGWTHIPEQKQFQETRHVPTNGKHLSERETWQKIIMLVEW